VSYPSNRAKEANHSIEEFLRQWVESIKILRNQNVTMTTAINWLVMLVSGGHSKAQ